MKNYYLICFLIISQIGFSQNFIDLSKTYVVPPSDGVDTTYYEWWEFDKSGQIKNIVSHFNGVLNGLSTSYYKSGQIKLEQHYVNGEELGLSRGWHENGSLMYETIEYRIEMGVYRSYRHSKQWNENGFMYSEWATLNGISHGINRSYYDDGNKMFEGFFVEGEEVGIHSWWYRNGKIRAIYNHYNNTYNHFNEDGSPSPRKHL
jgi:antitoxin component YwqK of YwqJK toxin-antitoxin module